MAVNVNYPCVVWETRYEVLETLRTGSVVTTDDELYRTRAEAEDVYVRGVLNGALNLRIQEYEVVFFAHCVVCGTFPLDTDYPFPQWSWVLEQLADSPGWLATPEQLVFCPAHRPDREDA